MDIDIIATRELTIVRCRGRLVFADGADLLHTAAAAAFLAGQDVVLDLRQVTQVDAYGAGVLADLSARARQEGRALSLTGATDRVRQVLRVTGLESVVHEESSTPDQTRTVPHTLWPGALAEAPFLRKGLP